jgi:acyl carrier protein
MRNTWGSLIGIALSACGHSAQPVALPAQAAVSAGSCRGLRHQARARRAAHKSQTDAATREPIAAEPGSIAASVVLIIKEQLDVDEKDIHLDSTFIGDLGADSLGLVELVLAFEEAFEIDIPDEDTEHIRTVGDAIRYIENGKNPANVSPSAAVTQ